MLASFRFMTFAAFTLAIGLTVNSSAVAQQSENRASCLNRGDLFSVDERISGCSALLQNKETQRYRAYIFNDRGVAFQAKGDYDRAIADYTDAIRLAPEDAKALYNRGTAYQAQHYYDRAIADYTRAIGLDPTYFRAYKNRGLAYQAKGDNSRASADLNEASRFKSDRPR